MSGKRVSESGRLDSLAASAPMMMMGRSEERDGMEDERGGGKKAFVRSYAKVEERRKRMWQ